MRQLPLNKSRFFDILDLYCPNVTMERKGGYDLGVYFSFEGKGMVPDLPESAGGRIVRSWGFTSEAIELSRMEQFSHAGLHHGLERFWERVEKREATLRRWLAEYAAAIERGERKGRPFPA